MSAEAELAGFIAKFAPDMQARFPKAMELVYDNYNFLVIGFGPTPRTSDGPQLLIKSVSAKQRPRR